MVEGSISRLIRQLQRRYRPDIHGVERHSFHPYRQRRRACRSALRKLQTEYFSSCPRLDRNTRVADYLLKSGVPLNRLEIIPTFCLRWPWRPPLSFATHVNAGAPKTTSLSALSSTEGSGLRRTAPRIRKDFQRHWTACALKLVLAGEGSERQGLKKLGEDLNIGQRVKMVGWTDRPDIAIRLSDVIAFTTS